MLSLNIPGLYCYLRWDGLTPTDVFAKKINLLNNGGFISLKNIISSRFDGNVKLDTIFLRSIKPFSNNDIVGGTSLIISGIANSFSQPIEIRSAEIRNI